MRAFLDTGAWQTLVRPGLSRRSSVTAFGRTFPLRRTGRIPGPNPQGADLYLGLDFIRLGAIAFSPEGGFSPGRTDDAAGLPRAWTGLTKHLDDHLHVLTMFDEVPIEALVDTGADASVINDDVRPAYPARWFRRARRTQIETFYGDVDAKIGRIGRVTVGPAELGRDVRVFGLSFGFLQPELKNPVVGRDVPPAILGWDVLGKNRWTLDASGLRIAFE